MFWWREYQHNDLHFTCFGDANLRIAINTLLVLMARVFLYVSQGGLFIFYLFDEDVVVRLCAEECVCVSMCVCVYVCVAIISWGNRLKLQKPESAV